MSIRTAVVIAVLWTVSLGAVAAVAAAQAVQPVPPGGILSGADVGFRVESMQGNTPVGTLVIRWKGQWVEPTTTKKVFPITR